MADQVLKHVVLQHDLLVVKEKYTLLEVLKDLLEPHVSFVLTLDLLKTFGYYGNLLAVVVVHLDPEVNHHHQKNHKSKCSSKNDQY